MAIADLALLITSLTPILLAFGGWLGTKGLNAFREYADRNKEALDVIYKRFDDLENAQIAGNNQIIKLQQAMIKLHEKENGLIHDVSKVMEELTIIELRVTALEKQVEEQIRVCRNDNNHAR